MWNTVHYVIYSNNRLTFSWHSCNCIVAADLSLEFNSFHSTVFAVLLSKREIRYKPICQQDFGGDGRHDIWPFLQFGVTAAISLVNVYYTPITWWWLWRWLLKISVITDNFFLGAGVWTFVVIGQILDWQYSHRHVFVKRLEIRTL